jgi:hypothetical protein
MWDNVKCPHYYNYLTKKNTALIFSLPLKQIYKV